MDGGSGWGHHLSKSFDREVDMALVRRAVGRASVPGQAGPGQPPGQVNPGPAAFAVPGQAGYGPTTPEQGQSAIGVLPGHELAASVASPPAQAWSVVAGLGLTGLGAFVAWNIATLSQPTVFQVGNQMSAFAALFVFSAAVERLIEPLTRWMPGRGPQERYERAVADMDNGVPGAIHAAAYHKAAADQARASRGILMWGIATFLATVLSASAGFYLLRLISADPGWHGVSTWVDALVTGLIVGSGTKPLHDLWNRIQPN
jgi:hypothetical protein